MGKRKLELIHSYKLKEDKLKILLHAPLHPSYWIYLMEVLNRHKFYIEPKDDFEGAMPRSHIQYTVVPSDSKIKFDAQIILLHKYTDIQQLYKLLRDFPIPPVFIEVWDYPLPRLKVKYPLISGCTYRSDSQYPNIRYSYVSPSKTLWWDHEWKGNKPQVFFPAQRYLMPCYGNTKLAKIYHLLKKSNIKMDAVKNVTRKISFPDWRSKFINNRVLLDCTPKYVSFVIEEAMAVGMPIVTLGLNESSIMVRDKIDGFSKWTYKELIELLRRFITDKEFADEWSLKSKARGRDILDPNKTRKVFNQALKDSIYLFNSTKYPFEMEGKDYIKLVSPTPIIPYKYDFTLICWELEPKIKNPNWGYPCRGYPSADKLVPAFKKLGANFQVIEFCDYADVNLTKEADKKDIFKNLEPVIQSNNVLIEWDGITSKRDYKNIFNWNREIYIIPHHEGRISGAVSSRETEREFRRFLTEKSTKIIFELQTLRNLWAEFECDKFELLYPPTRIGRKYDKMKARKVLGIKTPYVIIAWGQYTGKKYEEMLYWIADWQDTSLLFCGSGDIVGKKLISGLAKDMKITDKVFFSEHGISDKDSDLWFSASDLSTCPRNYFGTATSIYVIGQGKVCVVSANPPETRGRKFWNGYQELERISGIVTSDNIRRTTRELLVNEERRKVLELKSLKYAEENSFENYARRIMRLMGL